MVMMMMMICIVCNIKHFNAMPIPELINHCIYSGEKGLFITNLGTR